jgi:hypothetical protein
MAIESNINMKKVSLITSKNNILLQSIINTYKNIEASSDMKYIRKQQSDAKAVYKKIKDNVATMNDLLSRTVYTEEYLNNFVKDFLKKAQYISDTIPDTISVDDVVSAEVQFSNTGMFYSWDDDKGIYLSVKILDEDGGLYMGNLYPLDTILNPAGDQSTNGDFQVIKTFNIEFEVPDAVPGEYSVMMRIVDDTVNFESSYRKSINITL